MTAMDAPLTDYSRPLTHRAVLAMSAPIILSNLTTPVVGALGTAIVGQLGEPAALGGVAIGVEMFNLLFWSFGFLRLATSGLTAQAKGAADAGEIAATLERALLMAVALGAIAILIQHPLGLLSVRLMGGSADIQSTLHAYYGWRIWSAPFVFVNYAVLGWLIGLGQAGRAFALQLLLNVVNVVVTFALVLRLHWGAAGAGWARSPPRRWPLSRGWRWPGTRSAPAVAGQPALLSWLRARCAGCSPSTPISWSAIFA